MYEIYEQLLQKRGVTSYKVCRETGISQSVLSAWKNGKSIPKRETLQLIADFFDVSIDYLIRGEEVPQYYLNAETVTIAKMLFKNPNARTMLSNYLELPDEVRSLINDMVEYMARKEQPAKQPYPYIGRLAAAGSSVFSDIPLRVVYADPMPDAEMIVGINGDSMEPTFEDGDMVYVRNTQELNVGEIGIFRSGDEFYIKELGKDGLVSHNPAYPVMHGEFKCVGKVLGKVGD